MIPDCTDCGHPIDADEGIGHHDTDHPGLCCSCYEERFHGPAGRRNVCSVCGAPSVGWTDGPGGAAVEFCSDLCRSWIELAAQTQREYRGTAG